MVSHFSLPTELTIRIYCDLDSLSDALALSSTSRNFRNVWLGNADRIYSRLAPKCIEGEKYARALQLSGCSQISAQDASSICRRAEFTISIADQFEQIVVKRLKVNGYQEIYGGPDGCHPEYLTLTERRRFFRTYYQLWSLLRLPDQDWASAVKAFPAKELYLMREMAWIPLPIGEDQPSPKVERFPDIVCYGGEGRRGKLGRFLEECIQKHVKDTGNGDPYPWMGIQIDMSGDKGIGGFLLFWDHFSRILEWWCSD